jgi:hypothetical protein
MFLEIIPSLYDVTGRRSYKPHLKKKFAHPTFPFGRYVSRPLAVHCSTLPELRNFLRGCRQATDKETFGTDDYWLPPDKFEKVKQGDCDDFALWIWRQLMQMGYKARFVAGHLGRYKEGHAWVTFEMDGRSFIADGTRWPLGLHLPAIHNLKYHPIYSVEWDGRSVVFYSHEEGVKEIPLRQLASYFPDWVLFWLAFWGRNFYNLPLFVFRYLKRRLRIVH